MDKITNYWYNSDVDKVNKYKHLIMLDLEKNDLEKMSNGDDFVEAYEDKVTDLNNQETFRSFMTYEEDQRLIQNTEKKMAYDEGISQTAAGTETIGLTEANSYEIDLGLVENKKFDLKLDKSITIITVTDSRGTNVHEYNKNFAKIDFKDKYIDSSTMVVEYKIVVTNEGAVPGYVKKIADYLPTELEFSSELNTDWYASTDGKTVYNNANANKLLNPGESIEVKLVLTKKMNANTMGITITNNAEIYETSNDYGLEDVDSTSGNKASNEDDYSSANVLTSIQTGQAIIYTVLGLVIVTIIGGGAYVIKKKVIK